MALINEQDIDAAGNPPAMAGQPHPGAPAPEHGGDAQPDGRFAAPADLARDQREIENQLLNLRTEVAKHAVAMRKTVILAALLAVLASVGGQWLLFKPAAAPRDGGEPAAALHEMHQTLTALQGAVARLGKDVKENAQEVAGQRRQAAVKPDQQSPQPRQPTRPDCSKLPADVQATAVGLSIRFDLASAEISPESASILDSVAKILALAPARCVLIEGYSDASGRDAKNLALSHERAVAVVDYLVSKGGLDRKMLAPLGKGAQSSGQTFAATDPRNRRVIFRVVADEPAPPARPADK